MPRLLVLTAVDVEARGLARQLGLTAAGGPFARFSGGGLEIVAVGLGAAHLEARVPAPAASTLVVSAGACGALAPELAVGALIVPEVVVTADGARHPVSAVAGLTRRGALLSVAHVVADAAEKSRLWLASGALAVDMESAPILAWARARGLAAVVVRGVSDSAARGVPADLARVVHEDGRLRPLRAVSAVLARPGALADAMALRAGTAAALKTVAAALATLQRTS
ncbi:MAG TPA: hypothetical protein VFL90_07165 [Methylomirabilota bacterium]|nr:hypothetical protein [Methylomirabilota bacterium]